MAKKDKKQEDIEFVDEEEQIRDKIKKIKQELKKCIAEKQEYLSGWQRAKADYINLQKEEEQKRGEFAKFAAQNIIKDILPLADSLGAAAKNDKNLGILYDQLLHILSKHGLEPIDCGQSKFNPQEQEAVATVEVKDKSRDNIVIEEIQKGFKLNNKILRPAKVKVGVYKQQDK